MEIDPVFWKLARNWKETRRQMRKRYLSKKSFTYEIYAGTSKAAHKVFQQSGASSIREFSLLHNLQLFARKLWLKIGCLFNQGCIINQHLSIRHITVCGKFYGYHHHQNRLGHMLKPLNESLETSFFN